MRFDAADQKVVAVDDQVVGCDGGGQILIGGFSHIQRRSEVVICSITTRRSGVLRRIGSSTRSMNTASRSKDVDVSIGDFAVHTERQADFGHSFQHAAHFVKIGDTGG